MSARTVAAVVVAHHSASTLPCCLEVLLRQPDLAELVLVDNGSSDDWRAQLPADPRLRIIANAGNPGFAVACNQGAAASRAPWLLFLNPDCFLEDASLAALLDLAAGEPRLGALGAELVDAAGAVDPASRRHAPTPGRVLGRRVPAAAGPHGAVDAVEAISGALMLLPREAFAAVGGFDEGYRLHCEDLDLCRRLRAQGRVVAVANGVRVAHLRGVSSRRRPVWVEWQKHRGMLRYFRKFDAAAAPWWLRLVVPVGVWLRFPFAAARALWRARAAQVGTTSAP